MHDQSSEDHALPPAYSNMGLAKSLSSVLNDDSEASWRIIGVPALPAVAPCLIREMGIVLLPNCDHLDKHTAVVQSSYLAGLIKSDERVDVNHDPTQPSHAEISVYGRIVAAQKARERWLECVVELTSSEFPLGVQQACRDRTHKRGWGEELNEKLLIRDISQSHGDIRSRFWQSYIILSLLLHTDNNSEGVQSILGSKEKDLLDALRLAMGSLKTPSRPKNERAQITSLLRALYTLSGGTANRLYEVSGKYTTAENRALLGSMFGTLVSNGFEYYDAEEIQRKLRTSPMFSDVTLSVQNLEHLITQMRSCLYLGYPPHHLCLPSQLLSGLSTEHVNMFTAFLAHTYQEIPALQSRNNILMLLIWDQRTGHRTSEALQQWINSDDACQLRQSLLQEIHGEQPIEQLVINMAALMSFAKLCPDHDDDMTAPVHQRCSGAMNEWATGLPLGHSKLLGTMVYALIQVLAEERMKNLAIFLASASDRDPPRFDLFYGMCHEYICSKVHGRTTTRSHGEALKIVRRQLTATGLYPLAGSLSTGPDQISETSRPSDNFARDNPALCQDHVPDCYDLVRVSGISITEGKALVSLLRSNFEDFEIPSVEHLSDGSCEIAVLQATATRIANVIRDRFPASSMDSPLEPTTEDLDGWTHVNAAKLNWQWSLDRAVRIFLSGTTVNGMTLAAHIYFHHLHNLVHHSNLHQRSL